MSQSNPINIIFLTLVLTFTSSCQKQQIPPQDSKPSNIAHFILKNRDQWLQNVTFPNPAVAPIKPSPGCSLAHIIVLLPNSSNGFGHSALAINKKLYDFGPIGTNWIHEMVKQAPWQIQAACQYVWPSPGGYAWSLEPNSEPRKGQPTHMRAISFANALDKLKTFENYKAYTILDIPLEITNQEAAKLQRWWQRPEMVEGKLSYQVPGLHCSSAVIESLRIATGINGLPHPKLSSPSYLAYYMLGEGSDQKPLKYRNTCGARKGQIVKAAFLNNPKNYDSVYIDRLHKYEKYGITGFGD